MTDPEAGIARTLEEIYFAAIDQKMPELQVEVAAAISTNTES